MGVRAKFHLSRIEVTEHAVNKGGKDEKGNQIYDWDKEEMRTFIFNPVYGNGDPNHENTKFWKASPSGELKLGAVNPEVWPQFEIGKSYYLDFSEAPD